MNKLNLNVLRIIIMNDVDHSIPFCLKIRTLSWSVPVSCRVTRFLYLISGFFVPITIKERWGEKKKPTRIKEEAVRDMHEEPGERNVLAA